MATQTSTRHEEFTGVRVRVETPLSFEEVLGRLRNLTGHASPSEFAAFRPRSLRVKFVADGDQAVTKTPIASTLAP